MKKPQKDSSRIAAVDFLRIVFIGFIMMLHFLFFFGGNAATMRIRSSYIFVEAFFIITGYFTVKHFSKTSSRSIDNIAKKSISYTFKKFASYFPYVVIAILIGFAGTFLYRDYNWTRLFLEVSKFPIDILYGTVFYDTGHCGPLWYLSALFLVFPFFCIISQIKKHKNLRNIFCFILGMIFLLTGDNDTSFYPALYRAFSGLALGLLVYEGAEWLRVQSFAKKNPIYLQLFETVIFGFILFCVLHHGDFIGAFPQIRFDVLAGFVIMFTLIFSKSTYSHKLKIPFASSAAKLVLPLFLIHENIAIILYNLHLNIPFLVNVFIYYTISIIVAFLSFLVVEKKVIHKLFRHHTSGSR